MSEGAPEERERLCLEGKLEGKGTPSEKETGTSKGKEDARDSGGKGSTLKNRREQAKVRRMQEMLEEREAHLKEEGTSKAKEDARDNGGKGSMSQASKGKGAGLQDARNSRGNGTAS